jgi:hypothetical protein
MVHVQWSQLDEGENVEMYFHPYYHHLKKKEQY